MVTFRWCGIILLLVGMTTSMVAQKDPGQWKPIIDKLKNHYAPDRHLATFEITVVQDGKNLIVRGEVDNLKAHDEVVAELDKLGAGTVLDSIVVLPDQKLGATRYGIIAASVANIRSDPGNARELSTQYLMGTVVSLLKKSGSWYRVQGPDNYLGWLEGRTMELTDEQGVERWKAVEKAIVTAHLTMIRERPDAKSYPVSDAVAGMLLKKGEKQGGWVRVEIPGGRSGYISTNESEDYTTWKSSRRLTSENIEHTARLFTGVPYLWGGTSSKGMDCSGFTKTVYRLNGLELLRDADQQAEMGEEVQVGEKLQNLKKGDLLFFGRKASAERPENISHVGIYLENQEFIHTPTGAWVQTNSFDPATPNYSEYLLKIFVRARRIIGTAQIPEVKLSK
ncbi:MAG: NlpC/P60 family protein [bacterium]